MLNEVESVFTEEDNQMFTTLPTKNDIWKTICESNLNAAPESDGIPSLFYKECWKIMDDNGIIIKYLDAVNRHVPDITAESALLLQFESETRMELAIVWFLSVENDMGCKVKWKEARIV